ncbi:MAG: glutathione peroxidase [Bacteroidia bacterium]|jgi:glutathione peroxidase
MRTQILRVFYPLLMKGLSKSEKGTVLYAPNQALRNRLTEQILSNLGIKQSYDELVGKNLLIVNTASLCGFSRQYEELQTLQEQYTENLMILAFPSNEFKNQEPLSDVEIKSYCSKNYGITFPIAPKTQVLPSENQHPLYHWLCSSEANGWNTQAPHWNFSKYLLDEEHRLMAYFGPAVSPLDSRLKKLL